MNSRNKYLNKGFKNVEGWFEKQSLSVIALLSDLQINKSLNGSLIEIGVHHGRSFILLNLCLNIDELSIAYDIFDNQEQNLDNSGLGDKKILLDNLKNNNGLLEKVRIIQENSMNLNSDKILNESKKKARIFIVDGGHTYKIVYNDLKLAAEMLCDGGFIVVDDVFDFSFPEVSVALIDFLKKQKKLIPFLILEDKVFITNSEYFSSIYKNIIIKNENDFVTKKSKYLNREVIIVNRMRSQSIEFIRKSYLWQKIKNNHLGNKLRKLFQ